MEADDEYLGVLARFDQDVAGSARAVAGAVYAEVALVDRLRAAVGITVSLIAGGGTLHGRVAEVGRDAVVLDLVGGGAALVPVAAVIAVTGVPVDHRGPGSIVERARTFASMLRGWAGREVRVAVPTGPVLGVLERVGRDHLQLGTASGPVLVGTGQVQVVRVLDPQLDSAGSSRAPERT